MSNTTTRADTRRNFVLAAGELAADLEAFRAQLSRLAASVAADGADMALLARLAAMDEALRAARTALTGNALQVLCGLDKPEGEP
jgi:hypothetical protein